ncbi:MAG: PorT family protein [Bacteroidales bacterium]|jgi:hypothetical protein|nr:PorT family protein [Bacteroidales bacterium]
MKKLVVTVAAVLGLGFTAANAQNISAGIKADANMSNFILKDMRGASNDMKFGASLGGFMKVDIAEHFAIQPELLFHYKTSKMKMSTSKMKMSTSKTDFEYWGVEVPVYALGQWNSGNGRFYAGVGPYIGCGFSAEYKKGNIDLYDTDYLKRLDFGGGATVGYEFRNGLQINAGYKIGFLDMIDHGNGKMFPQTVSLGLGFRF